MTIGRFCNNGFKNKYSKQRNTRKNLVLCFLLLLVCLFPLSVFSESAWFPEWLEGSITPFYGEKRNLEAKFETSVEISAKCTYPYLHDDSLLISYVNKKLEAAANDLFDEFVEGEKTSKEVYNNDFGGFYLDYELIPVYCLPNLISIYGSESQSRACPHGWTHHEGKNFWKNENTIFEIDLKDFFIKESGWCNFLLHYCDHFFKSTRYGYYAMDDGFIPELEPEDLEIFVLTTSGLMIIFRSYRVGGWADGPDVITIPYSELKEFIDPKGPLKEVPGMNSIFSNIN